MGNITVEHQPPRMELEVWQVRVAGRLVGITHDKATADLLGGAEETRAALVVALEALRAVQQDRHDVGNICDDTVLTLIAAIAKAESALGQN